MNPDRLGSQPDKSESRVDRAGGPLTVLDGMRKWAHNKVLLAAAVIGISGGAVAACDMTEGQQQNQQIEDVEKSCAPFAIYFTNALYYEDTSEVAGFALNYRVPEGEGFQGVTIRIIGENDQVVYEDVRDLAPGSAKIQFRENEIPGVANALRVESTVDGKTVSSPVDFAKFNDDDDPIGF